MQFIIDFIDTATTEEIQNYLSANNCTVVKTFSSFDKTFLVDCSTVPAADPLVTSLIDNITTPISLLQYAPLAGDTYPKQTFATNDADQWWKLATFAKPDFNLASQTYERRGQTATVYVVDSGIMSSHPELQFADVEQLFTFNGDFTDFNGHGTAIASLISGNTTGVTAAKLVSVKLFQAGVDTLQSHMLEALDEIILHSQANSFSFPIVNLSWSIAKNTYIEDKIRLMIASGIFVVASAGNSGTPIGDVTPASMPEVITVGSYNEDLVPCDFSNYSGPISTTEGAVNHGMLDVWAPGDNLRVATLAGGTQFAAGTSMSAAIVSAALAFNSNFFVREDGSVPNSLHFDGQVLHSASGKDGVLTLADPYTTSVNKIACIRAEYDGDNGINYATISKFIVVSESGKQIEKLAFHKLEVASYNFDQPLPAGISIDANGWLVGSITTETPFLWESNLTYTKHSGHVQNSIMAIVVFPVGQTNADLPEGDPILEYTLNACNPVYFDPYYSCDGACTGGNFCHNACGSNNQKDQSSLQCTCFQDDCV